MKPSPLLDFWQKPAGAGAPVAMFATTFALEPDFFERNCLARFLEVTSVDEDTGSVDDIVASVELHELLRDTRVTVLADRSAPVQRTSLLWDLLSCQVENRGLLHAKVAVLLWENATRVILGSANLTSAGYRRQIELGMAADFGPKCLFPPEVLSQIVDELESYLLLVPGYNPRMEVFSRASGTLAMLRQRIPREASANPAVIVAFAPTSPEASPPLERLEHVWRSSQPLCATHLSPFWDSDDPAAILAVRGLLTGRPASRRAQHVGVVLGPRGQTSFSSRLAERVTTVRQLRALDTEIRTLHAKCLLIESDYWVAALIGSSNHTKAGLGLTPKRHREMNVWLGARRDSDEGKSLLGLIQLDKVVPTDAEEVEAKDEDEAVIPALPVCFGLCRVARIKGTARWELHLGIDQGHDSPATWEVALVHGEAPFLTRSQWEMRGKPQDTVVPLTQQTLPLFVLVRWEGNETPWAVIADDRHNLPPAPALACLRAQHLLDALASGRTLAQALRDALERMQAEARPIDAINLDPLKRFDDERSLLRRGRALARSLSAMQRRLERPVATADTLRARLAGPLGPEFVATKVAEAFEAGQTTSAEAAFTVAEIALTVGRVDWRHLFGPSDRNERPSGVPTAIEHGEGLSSVKATIDLLDTIRRRLGEGAPDINAYATRAIGEARRCLKA